MLVVTQGYGGLLAVSQGYGQVAPTPVPVVVSVEQPAFGPNRSAELKRRRKRRDVDIAITLMTK